MKILLSLLLIGLVSGCAVTQKMGVEHKPEVVPTKLQREFDAIPPPAGPKLSVAVYQFTDKTGQRKPTPGIASFSTAVTQGADVFLIKALQDVGHGQWFDVVERSNLDALTKERLIIKQMRDAYEGKEAKPLMPMLFAGIIFEGGIIGYDSSVESGGTGYNFLGIGPSTQYSKDVVTISLRAIAVNTGKIVAAVTVTKIIYSTADSFAVLKSIEPGGNIVSQVFDGTTGAVSATTGIFQFETGLTINEPGTLAVKTAVEAAVVEIIREGERKGVWDYRRPEQPKPQATVPAPVTVETAKLESVEATKTVDVKKDTVEIAGPKKMYFVKRTRVYLKKSDLAGPVYGPFVTVKANTQAVVAETEFKDVVEIQTDLGVRGFVKQDRLENLPPAKQ